MKIWIDAQPSPQIATWISEEFKIVAIPIRDIGLRDAQDEEIFNAAKNANAIVLTKDRDFLLLSDRFGQATSDNLANLREYFKYRVEANIP